METTCPTDGQRYGVALQSLVARPGYRTEPALELTTLEDVYGKKLGAGYRRSSHWVSQGRPVPITFAGDDGEQLTVTYSWPCGDHRATVEVPATDLLTCGACNLRELHANPPADFHTNPRYGSGCACCGHNGTHLVIRGGDAPACLKGTDG